MNIDIVEIKKNEVNEELIKDLFDIHKEVFLECDKLIFANFENEFSIENRIYFIAKIGCENVGYIGVMDCFDFFEIIGIGVKKKYQKIGVGTRLLDQVFNRAHEKKVDKIFLEVDEKNFSAKSFYEKNGFVVTNIRKKYYKDNDALIMVRNCL